MHGTVVVPKSGGGYQNVAFQTGKVTAVSSTSITLHSADGYSRTYPVTSSTIVNAQRDGIGSIKVGNQVVVSFTSASGVAGTAVAGITPTPVVPEWPPLWLFASGLLALGWLARCSRRRR